MLAPPPSAIEFVGHETFMRTVAPLAPVFCAPVAVTTWAVAGPCAPSRALRTLCTLRARYTLGARGALDALCPSRALSSG